MTDSIPATLARLRAAFDSRALQSYEARQAQLTKLAACFEKYERPLMEALHQDLRKSESESYVSELAVVHHELQMTRKKLRQWMRPKRVGTPLFLWPGRSEIHCEPLGVVLVIGAWNYPVMLTLIPLIGALAAGNSVVVKPSEVAPQTAAVIAEMLTQNFPETVAVVTGGVAPTTELLQQRFDFIFYTGSGRVGRIVYEAAAKHLTPVTLELGGKSPAFVLADADLGLAARRIAWGKFLNAGQTCVAPDYVYVDSKIEAEFLKRLQGEIQAQLGEAIRSPDYGRIVNAANFDRLSGLLKNTEIFHGGKTDASQRFIEPTVLRNVKWSDAVMRDEIFGPILPVLTFQRFDDAIREVRKQDKPLAAYFFGQAKSERTRFVEDLSFGGGCINDANVHLGNPRLPFGGVGGSGLGSYHGKQSFLNFSHQKSLIRQSRFFDFPIRYPPSSKGKLSQLRRLFKISGWLS